MVLRGLPWQAHKNRCQEGAAVFAFVNWGRIAKRSQLNLSPPVDVGESPAFILLSALVGIGVVLSVACFDLL
jgi:hypothetical protein